jgi:hypothetical protein
MPVARGIVKQLGSSRGGGVHVTEYVHQDGSPSHSTWVKSRIVFPIIEVGTTVLKGSFVAIDAVGHAINENINIGDDVALYYFRHILWNNVIIGMRSHASGFHAMTEDGKTNSHDGKWILNGEVILVEGGEGMMMQLSWRGNALVTEFGGATLTFNKV